jgi:UDP-glucuronate 4-epimerase
MKTLVTGAAGFIGFHLSGRLLARGDTVVGIDSINDYYDPALKFARLAELGVDAAAAADYGKAAPGSNGGAFTFIRQKLEDKERLDALVRDGGFDCVVNLAAQAGVRYSIDHPYAYLDSNLTGFLNVLEACRQAKPRHLVYASSSSVYGLNATRPFSVADHADHPVSLYAATKKANELMAHTYSHLYGIPTTGLRFFTVYGPWGRPDMAYFKFADSIMAGRTIDVYNGGDMLRDFTYVDDIVEGILRVIDSTPAGNPAWNAGAPDASSSSAPYRVYNIGNNNPVRLGYFVETLENALGRKADKRYLPMQPGDVYATEADVSALERDFGWKPTTRIEEGLARFAKWYGEYRAARF